MNRKTLACGAALLVLSLRAGAQASAPAGGMPSGEREGNLFHEPFFQLSDKIASCKPPRGPWWTAEEAKADIHWRSQSGVSCYLAGKCRLMNSYLYDPDIAERVKAVFERDFRFEDSSVWAHVQRRFVTLMGCVKDESQKSALIAAMQGIDDVNQVIDQLTIGPAAAPKYTVRPTR
jgi:hypothetical protein